MADVDPFHPWRPASSDTTGDAKSVPIKAIVPQGPQSGGANRVETQGQAIGVEARRVLTAVLVLCAFGALLFAGAPSVLRVGVGLVAIWLGCWLAISVLRGRRFYLRVMVMMSGLGLAAAGWFFVPSLVKGKLSLNWHEAIGLVEKARSVPRGEATTFAVALQECAEATIAFPQLAGEVEAVGRQWVKESIEEELGATPEEEPKSLERTLKRLRKLDHECNILPTYGSHRAEVITRYKSILMRLFARASKQMEDTIASLGGAGQFGEMYRGVADFKVRYVADFAFCSSEKELDAEVNRLEQVAFDLHTRETKAILLRHLQKGELEEVARTGQAFEDEIAKVTDDMRQRVKMLEALLEVRREAISKRLAKAESEINKLIDSGKLQEVPTKAEEALDMMTVESSRIGMRDRVIGGLRTVRVRAVELRVRRAIAELEKLLASGSLVEVARQGAVVWEQLRVEARFVGVEEQASASLLAVRRKAMKQRLDGARVEVRGLLVKDQYQAIGRRGDQVSRELGDEALAVGETVELKRFRDSCKAFADLAKKAGVEDGKGEKKE